MKQYFKYDLRDNKFFESERFEPKDVKYFGSSSILEFTKEEQDIIKKSGKSAESLIFMGANEICNMFNFVQEHIEDREVSR